jgi:hypothetical protein
LPRYSQLLQTGKPGQAGARLEAMQKFLIKSGGVVDDQNLELLQIFE